jgi:hypothetical protein
MVNLDLFSAAKNYAERKHNKLFFTSSKIYAVEIQYIIIVSECYKKSAFSAARSVASAAAALASSRLAR